ncbi:MAG: superoxide dismutase [Oscillospiraceae bacterium]
MNGTNSAFGNNPAPRTYPFVRIRLPYAFDALAPYIDARTMKIHYTELYSGYIDKLNAVLKTQPALQKMTLEELLTTDIPTAVRVPVQRFAGGVYNHELFFTSLAPRADFMPPPKLKAKLTEAFGSFEAFTEKLIATGMAVFGSGYTNLAADPSGMLQIMQTANQDTPLKYGLTPLLSVDVWEHAYFLYYTSHREDYLKRVMHVINWNAVEARMF